MAKKKAKARKKTVTKKSKTKGKRVTAKKGRKKSSSRAVTQVKQTAMKVLAGAAAGAVRAIVPPMERAASRLGMGPKEQKN